MTLIPHDISVHGMARKFYSRPNTTDQQVIQQMIVNRHYDLSRLRRSDELRQHLERKMAATGQVPLILDVGANIGASAVFFASLIPAATIVAIEPDAENFKLLEMNVAGLPIVPLRAAVASSNGFARTIDPGHGAWGYRTERVADAADGDVPRMTIGELYQSHAGRCFPFLVKVNIEGGEADLFAQNTAWVEQTPIMIVELHDWLFPKAGTSRPFLRCVAGLDRDFVFVTGDIYSIANALD
jgi:FkbM family methyltransferase